MITNLRSNGPSFEALLKDKFCPGRVDDDQSQGWDKFLKPRIEGKAYESILLFRASTEISGRTVDCVVCKYSAAFISLYIL